VRVAQQLLSKLPRYAVRSHAGHPDDFKDRRPEPAQFQRRASRGVLIDAADALSVPPRSIERCDIAAAVAVAPLDKPISAGRRGSFA
jgi:hypothetical protein